MYYREHKTIYISAPSSHTDSSWRTGVGYVNTLGTEGWEYGGEPTKNGEWVEEWFSKGKLASLTRRRRKKINEWPLHSKENIPTGSQKYFKGKKSVSRLTSLSLPLSLSFSLSVFVGVHTKRHLKICASYVMLMIFLSNWIWGDF